MVITKMAMMNKYIFLICVWTRSRIFSEDHFFFDAYLLESLSSPMNNAMTKPVNRISFTYPKFNLLNRSFTLKAPSITINHLDD